MASPAQASPALPPGGAPPPGPAAPTGRQAWEAAIQAAGGAIGEDDVFLAADPALYPILAAAKLAHRGTLICHVSELRIVCALAGIKKPTGTAANIPGCEGRASGLDHQLVAD